MDYNPQKIEKKWQEKWLKDKTFKAEDGSKKTKYYALIEFPYPSGEGLHVGHVRSYTAMDIIARKRRMEGFNVLYPIGWDAFGLPTENYAIKTGIHPKKVTKDNTDNFRRQLQSLGFSFDWDREINTTDPKYYKWTQWMFIQFFKHGLAYKAKVPINWCPGCKIGLANEEVVNGRCERSGDEVEKREKEQWMIKITAYAEKLLKGLEKVDYIPEAKLQQENWIGKSEGALIRFNVVGVQNVGNERLERLNERSDTTAITSIEVFTTRPDTLFGATYLVLAPEHPFVASLLKIKNQKSKIKNIEEIEKYIEAAKHKTDLMRQEEAREKTGVELKGVKAINPATKEEIPVWVADYVLVSYGTGAIMAVPSHDSRDFAFAKKFGLPMREVIIPDQSKSKIQNPKSEINPKPQTSNLKPALEEVYEGEGEMINSGKFDGMDSEKAKWEITKFVGGEKKVQYKLRDWVFSRQRYWGEPIPLVFCDSCHKKSKGISNFSAEGGSASGGQFPISKKELKVFNKGEILNPGWFAVADKDLPVKLPEVKNYKPTDTGESPLSLIKDWVNVQCPNCGGPAKRETDVMPNWAGSSWYYLAYVMRNDNSKPYTLDPKSFKYWLPVDWYNGGMEHTVLHLLYSRFWNIFLHDIGEVPVSEPYKKRTSHGLILGQGGIKMSKSKGNVVNPDDLVKEFGADSLRLYEMFIGPFNQAVAWDSKGILGPERFLKRIWTIAQEKIGESVDSELEKLLHKTIKKVSEDIESMSFNTVVSTLMILVNACHERETVSKKIWKTFLLILAPFAPHITEELWANLGEKKSIHRQEWPKYDPKLIQEDTYELIIQVNGKLRDKIPVEAGINEKEAESRALASEKIKKILGSQKPKKVIFVKGKLINLVV